MIAAEDKTIQKSNFFKKNSFFLIKNKKNKQIILFIGKSEDKTWWNSIQKSFIDESKEKEILKLKKEYNEQQVVLGLG